MVSKVLNFRIMKRLLSLVCRRIMVTPMLIHGLQVDGSLRVERIFAESGEV